MVPFQIANFKLKIGKAVRFGGNQIEIYFSILQRKALTPNDFLSLQALEERILNFQRYYEKIADPFEWKFTRKDLDRLMAKIKTPWVEQYRLAA